MGHDPQEGEAQGTVCVCVCVHLVYLLCFFNLVLAMCWRQTELQSAQYS